MDQLEPVELIAKQQRNFLNGTFLGKLINVTPIGKGIEQTAGAIVSQQKDNILTAGDWGIFINNFKTLCEKNNIVLKILMPFAVIGGLYASMPSLKSWFGAKGEELV